MTNSSSTNDNTNNNNNNDNPKQRRFVVPRDHGVNNDSRSVAHVPTGRDDKTKQVRNMLQRKIKTR